MGQPQISLVCFDIGGYILPKAVILLDLRNFSIGWSIGHDFWAQ
jgi:hypothetical protein